MKTDKRIKLIYLIVWLLIIFVLSAIPGDNYPATGFDWAPFVHIGEFFILTILWLNYFDFQLKNSWKAAGGAIVYAILDELHQIWVVNRNSSFADFALDVLGIFLALVCVALYQKIIGLRKN